MYDTGYWIAATIIVGFIGMISEARNARIIDAQSFEIIRLQRKIKQLENLVGE